PGTLRVISVRMNYLPANAAFASTLKDPTLGYVSRYALGRDYHSWIAGGVAGTIDLLAKSLKPGGIILIGEPYWRQIPATEEIAHA
ncbi:DUF1730 domain-containing protein, partial [Salmonella enterica subsp. enterica serovar Anatum]|nr:DUF1730 domain-containing protein [Salmonella enterica subsp. enterica serovar Anatum]